MGNVVTVLMFAGDQCGRAAEAVAFYAKTLPGVSVGKVEQISEPGDPGAGDLRRAEFTIGGTPFVAFDSAGPHDFTFTPAVSIWVDLDTETQLESVFTRLAEGGVTHMPMSDYGFSRQFTWVDDRYGVSWQLNLPFPSSD
jgi:predicted 3-demethylubiquinone-9 3-methyltransferase (glyoxalase superfamily)